MTLAQAHHAGIEYTIYTFERPLEKRKGDILWKKHAISADAQQAVTEAQGLFESHKFHKIEVKKKFFDPKKNRSVDETYKVFETNPKRDFRRLLMLVVVALCIGGGYIASYLLGAQ